jgi:hypothetical protein
MTTKASSPLQDLSEYIFDRRIRSRHRLRKLLINHLYPPTPSPYPGKDGVLNDIAGSLSRYVGNQRTVFDDGAPRSSSSSDASSMERQVERAFNQVLGGAVGRGAGSFISALNNAFPTVETADGPQVAYTSTRGMVSLYNTNGNGSANDTGVISSTGLPRQISARQAVLYREVSIIASDAQRVLLGLRPFSPQAAPEQVEALRAIVRTSINEIVDEFVRVEEPRPERVKSYFDTLWLNLTELGRRAFLNDPRLVTTAEDEAQTAGLELLQNYARAMREAWGKYYSAHRSKRKPPSISERVERANILLPILAQSNIDFMAAMDSVDFTEADRRSLATKFSKLRGTRVELSKLEVELSKLESDLKLVPYTLLLPDITPYDITEWLDRYASYEAPNTLAVSGVYALDYVVDQADTLFWVIAPIVGRIKMSTKPVSTGKTVLEQVLSNERVDWALNNILSQLDELAGLEEPSDIVDALDEYWLDSEGSF